MIPNNSSDFENQLRSLRPASIERGLREKLLEIPRNTPVDGQSHRNRAGNSFSPDGFLSGIHWRKWLVFSLPPIAVAGLIFLFQIFGNRLGDGQDISENPSMMPTMDQQIGPTFPEVFLAQSDYNQQVFVETRHLVPGISMGSPDIPLEMIHKVGVHQLYFPESPDGIRMEVAFPIRQIAFKPADIY